MCSKAVLVFCAQALLVQSALSQCTSRAAVDASGLAATYGLPGATVAPTLGLAAPLAGWANRNPAFDGCYPALDFTPTSGGGLTVTSASAIPPTGISVVSENVFEGNLAITGQVPFVGTTGLEGVLASAGAGAVNHACGNGINAMISEDTAFAPGYSAAYAPAAAVAPVAPFAPAAALAPAAAFSPASPFAPASLASPFSPAAAYSGCGREILL